MRISQQIFEKNLNYPIVISGAWGTMIHEKNRKQKILDTVPVREETCGNGTCRDVKIRDRKC
jgi:hypothetical protein